MTVLLSRLFANIHFSENAEFLNTLKVGDSISDELIELINKRIKKDDEKLTKDDLESSYIHYVGKNLSHYPTISFKYKKVIVIKINETNQKYKGYIYLQYN